MKRYAFVFNPDSGNGNNSAKLAELKKHIDRLPKSGLFYANGSISSLVQQLMPAYDVIVACGGDGTIREAAKPLVDTNKKLGIIPMGSGNDLVKSLNISKRLPDAFETLTQSYSTAIDVGQCNDFIFLNTLGFGYDGLTNRYSHDYQWVKGTFRYIFAAMKANIYRQNFEVRIDSRQVKKQGQYMMVTLANGRVEGGTFWIAPEASLTDGRLNLVMIEPISRWGLPFILPLAWLKKLEMAPQYHKAEVKSLSLSFNESVDLHADGEIITTDKNEFQIDILPQAINVIANL